MTTFEKIVQVLEQKGIKPTPMMKDLGFSTGLFSQWKKGLSTPSRDKIVQISKYLNVPVSYFLNDVSEAEPIPNENTYQIPIFESVSAGFGAYANDSIIGYMPLFITSESEAAETIIVRVRGDSMYPRIEDGALIQVHKQDYAENGNIAVVLIDDETAVVKRYFCDVAAETVRLESYNPEYPPRIFRGAEIERLKVLGVAKRIITDL